jgi:hypothetical protein
MGLRPLSNSLKGNIMAVLLGSVGYAGYLPATVVALDASTEAALIAQGRAVASTNASITTGPVTANVCQGICAIPAGSSSIVITNAGVNAQSQVFAVVAQAAADGTLLRVERVVCAAGSFTIYGTANATATTLVAWVIHGLGQTAP